VLNLSCKVDECKPLVQGSGEEGAGGGGDGGVRPVRHHLGMAAQVDSIKTRVESKAPVVPTLETIIS